MIGSGSFGKVFLSNSSAIKQIEIFNSPDFFDTSFMVETSLLSICNHPNIVKPTKIVVKGDKVNIVMPYYKKTLGDVKMDLKLAIPIMFQLLDVGNYMAENNVLHRDLKPENIMLEGGRPILIDFGLGILKLRENQILSTVVQTHRYRSPEIFFEHDHYDWKIDMWSLGAIFFQLVTGKMLLPGNSAEQSLKFLLEFFNPSKSDLKKMTKKQTKFKPLYRNLKEYLQQSGVENPDFLKLLLDMLQFLPENRPSYETCMKNPLFKSLQPSPYKELSLSKIPDQNEIIKYSSVRLTLEAMMIRIVEKYWIKFQEITFILAMNLMRKIKSDMRTMFMDFFACFLISCFLTEAEWISTKELVILANKRFKFDWTVSTVSEKVIQIFQQLGFNGYVKITDFGPENKSSLHKKLANKIKNYSSH